METNYNSYKFKICLTIEEYSRALEYFEKLTSEVEDFSVDDADLIRRLKKGLTKQFKKYLNNIQSTIDEENSRAMRSAYRNLLENYSNNLQEEAFSLVETLISCLNNILNKTKDNKLIAIIFCAKASLCAFLSQFSNKKSSNLELAYSHYKTAVEMSVRHIAKLDLSRLKIAYSYAKFIFTKIHDKYRSMLFVLNVLEEIHQIQNNENLIDENNENFNLDNFLKDLAKIERKFKAFHDKNIEEFNCIVRQYHPEYVG